LALPPIQALQDFKRFNQYFWFICVPYKISTAVTNNGTTSQQITSFSALDFVSRALNYCQHSVKIIIPDKAILAFNSQWGAQANGRI
jgi:hypothetical protein